MDVGPASVDVKSGRRRPLLWAGLGLLTGAVASIVLGIGLLCSRAGRLASALPSPAPIGTPRLSDAEAVFVEAEQEIYAGGDVERGLALLTELLPDLTEPDDLARAYQALAQGELSLGRFHRSAAYYERLYEIRPSPEVLMTLATTYDMAGDLERALGAYLRLLDWPGPEAEAYRASAQDRIDHIIEVIGTPTPSPAP